MLASRESIPAAVGNLAGVLDESLHKFPDVGVIPETTPCGVCFHTSANSPRIGTRQMLSPAVVRDFVAVQ